MPSLTIHRPAFLAVFLSIIAISLQLAAPSSIYHELEANQSCRCTAFNSSCWPSAQSWQDFNRSIDGRLIALSPPASPCHDPNFNAQACRTAQQRWGFPFWRADQPGAMQASNWEALGRFTCLINSPRNSTCFQGSVATYAVNATESRHIQAAIALAQARNLRIVIKNTGHDYLGRSTAPGALMIWTHNLREIVYHEKFAPMGCTIRAEDPPAMTIGAGIQWEDLYAAAFNRNHVVVGGGSSSVGGAGGNPMGAGHGPLSPLHGLAADNVLELKLVTADGRLIVANRCQNRDLYWALRGGGGGTFGVVVSLTHRLYPPLTNIVYASYSFVASSRRAFRDLLVRFTELHPSLERAGWSGVFAMSNLTALSMTYLLPNRNWIIDPAERELAEFPLVPAVAPRDPVRRRAGLPRAQLLHHAIARHRWNPLLLASRLIPRATIQSSPNATADAFIAIQDRFPLVSITGIFVAGGSVSRPRNNAVNPAWRRALWHVILGISWMELGDLEEERIAARNVSAANQFLVDLTPGSGAYGNEGDFNEPRWQRTFFGASYPRLLAIKRRADPAGMFRCRHCVGSEIWSEDLNCPAGIAQEDQPLVSSF
ncbi:hypothetical protein SELMODRAFT_78233 [Selaginella moellendorffii]|uniref:FAD-binding PCMH-type domain-containing protein n=1 Tax=Selaginella moellendorffii TaxID=88036 RepID=D8QVE6_SELML|nr:hypothetical protein SELMODRAFT_78233 [Selaginella moellendorffii]